MRSLAGKPYAGFKIGVLALNTCHVLTRGNVQNAETFPYPILYRIVDNISGAALMSGDMAALDPIVEGARALEREGVDVIVGACGSFANFQLEVARAVNVPVFMSILLEVPLLLRALPLHQKLGIVFATRHSFTDRVRTQCEIHDTSRIVTLGAEDIPAFQSILKQQNSLDDQALEAGVVEMALAAMRKHSDLGMWLLQCSDLPPYARALQKATRLPVFDMVTMIDHIYSALNRRGFER